VTPPRHLPAAACNAVLRSLLKQGFVEECAPPFKQIGLGWRQQDGAWTALRVTDAGLLAIGAKPRGIAQAALDVGMAATPPEAPKETHSGAHEASADLKGWQASHAADAAPEAATAPPSLTMRASLRNAAQRVLSAWDDEASERADPAEAMAALRDLLTKPTPAGRTNGPRKPREGTKQQQVLGMLRRPEGATVAQVADATGWANYTVRGLFAGLKRRASRSACWSGSAKSGPTSKARRAATPSIASPRRADSAGAPPVPRGCW
jgi:Protein of unknown function (DUF3489)